MNEPRALAQVQRWMQAVITHPGGIAAGLESEQARSEIDLSAPDVEQVVSRSRNLTSIERLEVYGNAYYARLLECLREEFPALRHAVGEETFDSFAFGYLQAYPSQSYTLAALGARFPLYLRETRPMDEAQSDGPSWPDLLIDLATLERTYSEVFDGPGVENEPLLTADELLKVAPDAWAETRIVTVPCLRLLRLDFPAHEYASTVKHGEQPSLPEARETFLAVSRRDYIVRRWDISAAESMLLESLQQGETLGDAIASMAESSVTDAVSFEELAGRLREWFQNWTAWGLFQSLR